MLCAETAEDFERWVGMGRLFTSFRGESIFTIDRSCLPVYKDSVPALRHGSRGCGIQLSLCSTTGPSRDSGHRSPSHPVLLFLWGLDGVQ